MRMWGDGRKGGGVRVGEGEGKARLLTRRSSLFLDGVWAISLSAISAVLPSHHTVREHSKSNTKVRIAVPAVISCYVAAAVEFTQ